MNLNYGLLSEYYSALIFSVYVHIDLFMECKRRGNDSERIQKIYAANQHASIDLRGQFLLAPKLSETASRKLLTYSLISNNSRIHRHRWLLKFSFLFALQPGRYFIVQIVLFDKMSTNKKQKLPFENKPIDKLMGSCLFWKQSVR